jgi:hypothetical protein
LDLHEALAAKTKFSGRWPCYKRRTLRNDNQMFRGETAIAKVLAGNEQSAIKKAIDEFGVPENQRGQADRSAAGLGRAQR